MGAILASYPAGTGVDSKKHVTLIDQSNKVITLPITNPQTQYGELAANWTQVPRPGVVEPAFNVRGPRPLRTITLQVTVVDMTDMTKPIDTVLNDLTTFLQEATTIRLSYATFDNSYLTPTGNWVCTSWQPSVIMRDPTSWSPIAVQGNIVLTEANPQPFTPQGAPNAQFVSNPGTSLNTPVAGSTAANNLQTPISSNAATYPGGKPATTASGTALQGSKVVANSQPSNSSASGGVAAPGKPKAAKYTVKAGDTLTSISMAMYGTANGWRAIGSANNITDPRLLQVGTVLTIPSS